MNGLAPTLTQNPTIPSSTPARATVFAALLLSSIVAAQAQTASVAPVNAPAADEEAVTLSPFAVTTQRNLGYVATNSLSGTRFTARQFQRRALRFFDGPQRRPLR